MLRIGAWVIQESTAATALWEKDVIPPKVPPVSTSTWLALNAWQSQGALGCAFRYGEAKNPGPYQVLTVCVFNPTTVYNHVADICKIPADLYILSETGAMDIHQKDLTHDLAQNSLSVSWGYPVPQFRDTKSAACNKGAPIGVALWSRLPLRACRESPPDPLHISCRYQEAWVTFGRNPVLVIVIYCFTTTHREHRDKNLVLLTHAAKRAAAVRGNVMLGGDFNAALQDDRIVPMLEQQGFLDVMQMAKSRWPDRIHPTCMEVTYPDNLLIKGPLTHKIMGASVLTNRGLGAHLPFLT